MSTECLVLTPKYHLIGLHAGFQRGAKYLVGGPRHRGSSETDNKRSYDREENFNRVEDSTKKKTLASEIDGKTLNFHVYIMYKPSVGFEFK